MYVQSVRRPEVAHDQGVAELLDARVRRGDTDPIRGHHETTGIRHGRHASARGRPTDNDRTVKRNDRGRASHDEHPLGDVGFGGRVGVNVIIGRVSHGTDARKRTQHFIDGNADRTLGR